MERLALLFAAVALASCGGGGGNPGTCSGSPEYCNPPPPSPSPAAPPGPAAPAPDQAPPPAPVGTVAAAEGLWVGTSSNGRTTYTLIQDNGKAWLLYSAAGRPSLLAGAGHGTVQVQGDSFEVLDAIDLNFEGLGVSRATARGTFTPRSVLAGSIIYPQSTVTFRASFDPEYLKTPTLSSAAGQYQGNALVAGAIEVVTARIFPDGAIIGSSSPSGCAFFGSATPRPSGNVFATRITFQGAPCSNGTATIEGSAVFNQATGQLISAGLNPARTNGFLFIAQRVAEPAPAPAPAPTPAPAPAPAPAPQLDPSRVTCASFSTQREAQTYYARYGARQLDGDGDGIACEALR